MTNPDLTSADAADDRMPSGGRATSRRTFAVAFAAGLGGTAIGLSARGLGLGGGSASASTAMAMPMSAAPADAATPPTGCDAAASPAGGNAVAIDNFTFEPQTLTVDAGTTVTWTNHDDVPHTVTSDDKTTFASKGLDTDDTFAFRFTKPGTYDYFCSIHPVMTATVIVK